MSVKFCPTCKLISEPALDADKRHRLLSQKRRKLINSQQIAVARGSVLVLILQASTLTERSKLDHMMLAQAISCIPGKELQA